MTVNGGITIDVHPVLYIIYLCASFFITNDLVRPTKRPEVAEWFSQILSVKRQERGVSLQYLLWRSKCQPFEEFCVKVSSLIHILLDDP